MPELRRDAIVERWVVMAPDRANRPIELRPAPPVTESVFDPFEEGAEQATPAEVLAYRDPGSEPNGPGWRVRVVPNKFPALQREGNLVRQKDGIYDVMSGIGAHEVIIECPHNEASMSRLSPAAIQEVLSAYVERMRDLKRDPRLAHALIFKNKGLQAGASLPHSHSQLIASPVVPITIWEEIDGALKHYQQQGRSIFDEIIEHEQKMGARIVLDSANYLAFCPYASRFQYETWIFPKQPGSHFEATDGGLLAELAQVLRSVLQMLDRGLGDPPYNYVIHSAPFHEPELPHFRWHIEIYPRMSRIAGYEWGSGFYINPMYPEEAAAKLRAVNVQ